MWKVYSDDICIHDDTVPDKKFKLVSPKLTLEENNAGEFTFQITEDNIGYSNVNRVSSRIIIYKNDEKIWEGRANEESIAFNGVRSLTCEGQLAFLHDSIQPQSQHRGTVAGFLNKLLNVHNAQMTEESHKFYLGKVTVTDSNNYILRYTDFETTLECINKKLVENLGGYLFIRESGGMKYLDYLKERPNTASQTIQFGKNLLDYSATYTNEEFVTALLPTGAEQEEAPIPALVPYLTVESVNGGSPYVSNKEAVKNFGWICIRKEWEDVTVAYNLLHKAETYLKDTQFEKLKLELSAVDLSAMDININSFKMSDNVRVISAPHGMDRTFPITKIEYTMDKPSSDKVTLGDDIDQSLTSNTKKEMSEAVQSSKDEAIAAAARTASQLIYNATTGYVNIITNDNGAQELVISDTEDYKQANNLWIFNNNGLGHVTHYGDEPNVAMTMDGSIVADRISTGVIKDSTNKNSWNLNTGKLDIKDGSVNIQTDSETSDAITLNYQDKSLELSPYRVRNAGKTTDDKDIYAYQYINGYGVYYDDNYIIRIEASDAGVPSIDIGNGKITLSTNDTRSTITIGNDKIKLFVDLSTGKGLVTVTGSTKISKDDNNYINIDPELDIIRLVKNNKTYAAIFYENGHGVFATYNSDGTTNWRSDS